MPKEIKAAAVQGGIRHDNHTAPVILTQRTFNPLVNYILIKNRSLTNPAEISFDGITSYTLDPKESLGIEGSGLKHYWTSGNVQLQVIIGSEK